MRRGAEKAAKIFQENGGGPVNRRRGATSRRTSSPAWCRPERVPAYSRHRPRALATISVRSREVWPPRPPAMSISFRQCRISAKLTVRTVSGYSSGRSPSFSGERVGRKGRVVKNDGLCLAAQETDLQLVPEVLGPFARPVGPDALEPGTGFHVMTESVMSEGQKGPVLDKNPRPPLRRIPSSRRLMASWNRPAR